MYILSNTVMCLGVGVTKRGEGCIFSQHYRIHMDIGNFNSYLGIKEVCKTHIRWNVHHINRAKLLPHPNICIPQANDQVSTKHLPCNDERMIVYRVMLGIVV